ncbi:hypothetical protein BN971_03260 [Mycobacterium bohemicum DSM 44277]|uniref:Uncharacterized protein n=1 Tax=Mycobacterium bohemicum DSM 44277 TaxID=1236609 RepID=A0A0U0WAW6_MYCBE|nr:hypothetical protein BN971_03260 [Mycobacterium bohemicum DSM 44277]
MLTGYPPAAIAWFAQVLAHWNQPAWGLKPPGVPRKDSKNDPI